MASERSAGEQDERPDLDDADPRRGGHGRTNLGDDILGLPEALKHVADGEGPHRCHG